MKLNKKIIIPAFTLLVGTALAGSVSSTVAWYQYSTKANVAYLGTSAGTTGNLLVRINKGNNQAADADWSTFISYSDVDAYFSGLNLAHELAPVTTGAMGRDVARPTLRSNPVCGSELFDTWTDAPAKSYVEIPLQFKFVETTIDAQDNEVDTWIAKDVVISDLLIQNDYSNAATKIDMSSAIRVQFDGYLDGAAAGEHTNRLASKNGGNTVTVGSLDLDGDGKEDKSYAENEREAMYGFGENAADKGTVIQYGKKEGQTDNNQVSYSSTDILNKSMGRTSGTPGTFLNIMVTIWVEGWQELPVDANTNSAIWDVVKTVNSKFDVGMQFEAKDIQ